MRQNKKTIGILGGMGPEASVYMYGMLNHLSIKRFNAKNNDDFPSILIDSIPVPDFISNNNNKQIALTMLKERVKLFKKDKILCLSIACNTAHVLLPELQKETDIQFVSIINEVVKNVKEKRLKRVGLISTFSTIKFKLYHNAFANEHIETITPTISQIKTIEKVIRNVIAGKLLEEDTEKLAAIGKSLKKRGAEGIVLGCTETPLVFPKKFSIPIFNSVEILSIALLRKYYAQD